MQRNMRLSPHSHPQLEPIEPIQAANALAIDEPPLTPQQAPNPQVAKPRPRACARSRMRSRKAD